MLPLLRYPLFVSCALVVQAADQLVIPASPQARAYQRLQLDPSSLDPKVKYSVALSQGTTHEFLPVQTDVRQPGAYFILPWQDSEKPVSAVLVSGKPVTDEVVARKAKGGVEVAVSRDGKSKPIFFYQADEILPEGVKAWYQRGAFIHPLYTPSETLVSDSFAADHLHHHGIWTAWSHTSFQGRKPDFWNVQQNEGRVASTGVTQVWSGTVDAGFVATMRSFDTKTQPETAVLDESWVVRCYRPAERPAAYIIDLETTQENVAAEVLELTKHLYGGLGFRGRGEWDAKVPLTFLTAEGETDRKKGDGKRTRWFYFGGPVGDKLVGVAILGHPDNLNAPQWTRFNPTMPFVAFTPVHDAGYTFAPHSKLVQKFRFVVFDGPPNPVLIEAYWQGFAQPATVTLR
mgnify:CR=1 FL=1